MVTIIFFSAMFAFAITGMLAPIFIIATIWLLPFPIFAVYILLFIALFLYFYRKYRAKQGEWDAEIEKMTQVSRIVEGMKDNEPDGL